MDNVEPVNKTKLLRYDSLDITILNMLVYIQFKILLR